MSDVFVGFIDKIEYNKKGFFVMNLLGKRGVFLLSIAIILAMTTISPIHAMFSEI